MASVLKGVDADLRNYIQDHMLPEIYEALLTGLTVMTPKDPHQFIIDKLRHLIIHREDGIAWDMFVDESMKPKEKPRQDNNMDFIFNFDDVAAPTPEMLATAYSHYNWLMKTKCFRAWIQFHLRKIKRKKELAIKMERADTHYRQKVQKLFLDVWVGWTRFRKGRQSMAFNKIEHVFHISVGRVIFQAWHNVTLDAKRTREYFEANLRRLERGEHMDEEESLGLGGGEARDDISMLPKAVAVKIFSYVDITDLARCAAVCRSWKVITSTNSLWSSLNLYKVRNRITDRPAGRLMKKCRPYLGHLNLRGAKLLTKPTFLSVSECRNLQDLNLSECTGLDDISVHKICEGCHILLYLNLSHTYISDASLRSMASHCHNLQFLSLAYCKKFTDKGLYYLGHGIACRKMVYLDMSGCTQVSPTGFKGVAPGCFNLQYLLLNEIPLLSDESVMAITEYCKFLKYISFLGSPYLSDETFKQLANNRRLEVIKIEGNQKITDASLRAIAKGCPDLRHVYLVDCQKVTDLSLKALASCRNLTVLNIADCVRISDAGVKCLAEGLAGMKLRELNLTNCVRVGDIALVNLHKRCHSLAYLSVCFCSNISEAGIELLGQTHSLTSLDISGCNCGDPGLSALGNNPRFNDVTLAECSAITDLGLQKFVQQCKDIETLDLSHCFQLTDGAIKNLAFCCRMVNVLDLSGCKLLTDLSIQYLSGVCHYLHTLNLSGCILISDKSMKYLKKGCKKLRNLTILYCKGITKQTAFKMSKKIENVNYNSDDVPPHFGYAN